MYSVSEAIFTCLCAGIASIVCMLCNLSAIFIRITRTSSFNVKSIFLKFSACIEASCSLFKREIFVRPFTILATVSPNNCSISSRVYSVSSTTSCNKAAAIEVAPKPISIATILATAIG